MLTDLEFQRISSLIKIIKQDVIHFPDVGEKDQYAVDSKTSPDSFVVNLIRGSNLKPKKSTYQIRTENNDILFRIDLDGPAHPNPNGVDIPCPHLHIYKYDGTPYVENWAFPLQDKIPTNSEDLIQVFLDFLRYNQVEKMPMIVEKMEF